MPKLFDTPSGSKSSARHDLHTKSDPTNRRVNRRTQAGQRSATEANFKSFTRNF